jgi:hypothetical protein
LVYRIKKQDNIIGEDKEYQRMPARFFVKENITEQYQNQINGTRYGEDEIERLINLLNHRTESEVKNIKVSKATHQKLQLEIFIGG